MKNEIKNARNWLAKIGIHGSPAIVNDNGKTVSIEDLLSKYLKEYIELAKKESEDKDV
jgi:intein-encoded DNA endonuclease-like protein